MSFDFSIYFPYYFTASRIYDKFFSDTKKSPAAFWELIWTKRKPEWAIRRLREMEKLGKVLMGVNVEKRLLLGMTIVVGVSHGPNLFYNLWKEGLEAREEFEKEYMGEWLDIIGEPRVAILNSEWECGINKNEEDK
jgi:hypothetical protein